jgi:hypothetical protein
LHLFLEKLFQDAYGAKNRSAENKKFKKKVGEHVVGSNVTEPKP